MIEKTTKKVNSKGKGNVFERKIAKTLSERFAAHTGLPISFIRNPSSGAYFGGKNSARTQTHDLDKASFGDLICPKDFRFNIECKHYKEPPSFAALVKQEVAMFDKWISQSDLDSQSSNTIPLIIIKYNNVPEFAMIPKTDWTASYNMIYRDHVIMPLTSFLSQPDEYYFTNPA